MKFTLKPLSQIFGAEVTGIDLSTLPDEDTQNALNEAWVKNAVLVIRDQHLSPPQFVAAERVALAADRLQPAEHRRLERIGRRDPGAEERHRRQRGDDGEREQRHRIACKTPQHPARVPGRGHHFQPRPARG